MAAATDLLQKVGTPGTATNLAGAGYTIAGTSITVTSTTNWPTDTGVTFAIDVVTTDSSGAEVRVDGTYCEFVGVVTSGTVISSVSKTYGTAQNYSAGATTRVYIPVSSTRENRIVTWGSAHANQDGSLITSAVQTALGLGTSSLNGWTALGYAPSTVTANGNRSYDVVFSSVDLTSTLSAGMRLKNTRTVTAPTRCTSLNGTTQYYSKTSPNKLTFTNNFVCSAWIKLTSYSSSKMAIISRYNGTSGWEMNLVAGTGEVQLTGYNAGATNFNFVVSKQAVPLNKWVHVAAQLDMSSATVTGGTVNYIMIDGVDVPCSKGSGGTAPTSLLNTVGDLAVGASNGASFFPGKIAQAAVYNAKVTQATIKASMNQTLSGSETSLASAYSFNGLKTDLNTTTPNDLTANGSAVETNADSPFGLQADGTTTGTTEYGIIMKTAFSTNTTVTVQVPEGNALPTSGGITTVVYSSNKAPYGMPVEEGKWAIETIYLSATTAAASAATAYNTGSAVLYLPTGAHKLSFEGNLYVSKSGANTGQNIALLSLTAANTTPINPKMSSVGYASATGATVVEFMHRHGCNPVGYSVSTATPVYANIYSEVALTTLGWYSNSIVKGKALEITAVCAYL